MQFFSFVKRIAYGKKATSETYIRYLRGLGVKIGEACLFYAPAQSPVDVQYPWMITIGDHVRIAAGVKILTHDYAWSVIKRMKAHEGEILGACGHVVIGDNVFVGRGAVITRNVTIGDNVIIGAGSVVTKDCQPNSVYAGNPARRLMDLESFYQKRKAAQLQEAKELACAYVERYGRAPRPEVFHEYFMLFCDAKAARENTAFWEKIELCGNAAQSLQHMTCTPPMFCDYAAFLQYCLGGDAPDRKREHGNEK